MLLTCFVQKSYRCYAEDWGRYAELQVLQKQMTDLSALPPIKGAAPRPQPAPSAPLTPPQPAAAALAATGRGHGNTMKQAGGGDAAGGDVNWLASNLPRAGFGFSAQAGPSAPAAAGSYQRGDEDDPDAETLVLPFNGANGDGNGGAGHHREPSFAFDAVPNAPATPGKLGPNAGLKRLVSGSHNDEDVAFDGVLSLGQISLHETLSNRAQRLRQYCKQTLGDGTFAAAYAAAAAAHGAGAACADATAVEQQVRSKLSGAAAGSQLEELVALLDELAFIDTRKGAGAWAK